ncbi:dna-directed rna polymerases i ii and iii subunit rpabc2 [Holotrichia oblita]|uniref:Dna-directed rna polymerases i ii and iii subunit rpabc2 n=1 Tax=Holotrichia oblita TaxID=644536 RepID=A0ACB9SU73_HOLOL|nr:dna-directed rna polymerases i ii and iii subunit rpabc2 [Holotrichia oblita]
MHSWLESESSKGSYEIASAVYDTLNKIEISEVINEVKLIADGCSGQNKNSTILAMAAKWLSQAPRNIKKVQLIFPVTGHSFLRADRLFALIEKGVKKLDTIILPDEYYDIFKKHGTLKKLNYDWHIQDWKKRNYSSYKINGFPPF